MLNSKEFFAYSASAGSGKTYALALRYIALLFKGVEPSSILAATFTKKAANEMRQRVLSVLKSLDDDFLANLQREYAIEPSFVKAKSKEVLDKFLNSQSHIVTLDSFFTSILRSSALEIGLEPDFKINYSAHEELNRNFIKSLDRSGDIDSLVSLSLNLKKRNSQDIVELYDKLFTIDVLLPEFSFKAHNLRDLEESINSLRVETLELVTNLGTSKSAIANFAQSNIKEFIKKGLFEKESLSEHRLYAKYVKKDASLDAKYLELKGLIASYHIALEETILHYLFKLYQEYKRVRLEEVRAQNELDFNDILYFTYRLLSSEITKEFLYFKLDSKFLHILLDEFQDTSSLQYLILKPLIEEIFAGIGQSEFRSFFYVGDVKQSLYRFRGGVEELFGYIANEYGIKVENLEKNYRSAKLLVNGVNSLFSGKIDGFIPAIAHSKKEGYLKVVTSEEPLIKVKDSIEELLANGVNINSIAALVFTNKDGVSLQEYLKEHNINSLLKTSSSLKSNPKIAALVGVVEYLVTKEQIFIEPFLQKCGIVLKEFSINYYPSILPFDLLQNIIREYGYFDNDLNILKLLEFASNYTTLEQFLYEFNRSSIELATKSVAGISIMTIHGSKGLEFEYVVVMDRLGKSAPNSGMLLFKDRSPIKIDNIYYRYSKKENFVLDYKKSLEKEKEQSLKDKLNLLYVALTRAEIGMVIVKKEKASEFALLDINDTSRGNIIKSKSVALMSKKILPNLISHYGKQDVVAQSEEDSSQSYNQEAIAFGDALHYALELLDFNNKGTIAQSLEAVENRYGILLNLDALKSIENRLNSLFNSSFIKLFNGAKIYKEQPLAFGGSFYKLDLMLEYKDSVVVVDYKSSAKFKGKHIKQVSNYKDALKSIYTKSVKAYIAYILEDRVEIVEV